MKSLQRHETSRVEQEVLCTAYRFEAKVLSRGPVPGMSYGSRRCCSARITSTQLTLSVYGSLFTAKLNRAGALFREQPSSIVPSLQVHVRVAFPSAARSLLRRRLQALRLHIRYRCSASHIERVTGK